MINIEVAYATPEQQLILPLAVPENTDLRSAVLLSGIAQAFPGLDVAIAPLGLFGRKVAQPEAQMAVRDREGVPDAGNVQCRRHIPQGNM